MARNVFKNYVVENAQKEIRWFERRLKYDDMAFNTISSYSFTLRDFLKSSDGIVSAATLLDYKGKIMQTNTSATVNARINGLNRYLKEKDVNYHLKTMKVQRKTYTDNVISLEDYTYLKRRLKRKEDKFDYFLIWALGSTGCRVSEIVKLKVEHIYTGRMVIYGKKRERVVYITRKFMKECQEWLEEMNKEEGFIFEENGLPMDTHKIESRIKKLAKEYGIDPTVMYPHSFRHMYAKACYGNGMGLADLSDVLGHASIETTRLYVQKSISEQYEMINRIVNW